MYSNRLHALFSGSFRLCVAVIVVHLLHMLAAEAPRGANGSIMGMHVKSTKRGEIGVSCLNTTLIPTERISYGHANLETVLHAAVA